jgi:hypothetical protein
MVLRGKLRGRVGSRRDYLTRARESIEFSRAFVVYSLHSNRPTNKYAAKGFLIVRKLIPAIASLVTIYALTLQVSSQSVPNKQEVITRARSSYYNLPGQGFNGFKASIEPNWEVILGHTATPETLKVFRALRFSMTLDASGNVTISHEVVNPEKIRLEPYINQIHENVRRLVASFFGTWSMFVVSSPFPEAESQIKIENSGKEYQLLYTFNSADAMLTLTSDLLIVEWKLTGPGGTRTVKPAFQKSAGGLLLTRYQTNFEPSREGIKTSLSLQIEYQDVSGMKLPHKLQIKGIHGSEPIEAELEFNHYVLNPR